MTVSEHPYVTRPEILLTMMMFIIIIITIIMICNVFAIGILASVRFGPMTAYARAHHFTAGL
jgi:hypothetical protein